jgi:hypothetical protein
VNVHDFEEKKLGKVVPYGVYDVTANAGFVSLGITSDTTEFSTCIWWSLPRRLGPNARRALRHDHSGSLPNTSCANWRT